MISKNSKYKERVRKQRRKNRITAILVASLIILGGFSIVTIENRKKEVEAIPLIPVETQAKVVVPVVEVKQELPVKLEPKVTQEEMELLAILTMAEAEGESELGKRLVIDTVLNRVDSPSFPNTINDVVYYPNAFSPMWNGRFERCYVREDILQLVKEELENRTDNECVFFRTERYSDYGIPMYQEENHYFSKEA